MNNAFQLEDKVSRSRSKHEGEPSAYICDRLSRTRVSSQRQLPTDHDYAVPTREYQLDQSSPLPATAAADPVLDRKKRPAHLDRSLHINVRIAGDTPISDQSTQRQSKTTRTHEPGRCGMGLDTTSGPRPTRTSEQSRGVFQSTAKRPHAVCGEPRMSTLRDHCRDDERLPAVPFIIGSLHDALH